MSETCYNLTFYVPSSHLETTKSAVFSAGAGEFPEYSNVCFAVKGAGQFRPGEEATPAVGERGKMEMVEEWRVEVQVVGEQKCRRVVEELKRAHPYEVPVYAVVKLEDF